MNVRSTSLIGVVFVLFSTVSFGQRPPLSDGAKDVPQKIDWDGLRGHLERGDYAKAKGAADTILESVRPDRKAPDFLPRCEATIDALMRRGFAELQLGHLDPAEATFTEAQSILSDREFKKQFSAMGKLEEDKKVRDWLIDMDLRAIELRNLQAAVILERLRRAHATDALAGEPRQPPPGLAEQVGAWVETIRGHVASTEETRKELAERFEQGGAAVVGSPHKRALMSSFHPDLIAGIVTFEAGRFPFAVPPSPNTENPSPAFRFEGLNQPQLLEKSLVHFDAASRSLQGAFESAIPKGIATAHPDKRLEADVLLVQLALARCAALLTKGDLPGAQKEVDEVFRLQKDLASLRKVSNVDSHPELILPLLLATEIGFAQAEDLFKTGMIDEARAVASRAAEHLARASALPLPDDDARRLDLARLSHAAKKQQERFDSSEATADAAEVATRRVRRAVERTVPGP